MIRKETGWVRAWEQGLGGLGVRIRCPLGSEISNGSKP